MKAEGLTLETAMHFFDTDGSGSISRDELNEGFKDMKVNVGPALLKNLFVILDADGGGSIDLAEFTAAFHKYMSTGGNQAVDLGIAAEGNEKGFGGQADEIGPWADENVPAPIKNSFNAENYQTRIDEQIQNIRSDNIDEEIIGGEIILKI
jgi:hypothetical protein